MRKKTLAVAMAASFICNPIANVAHANINEGDISIVEGSNRVKTSVNISKKTYSSSKSAVLVNGNSYPDSISAIAVSASEKCPIILTVDKNLEDDVADEIKRLGAEKVFIVGGNSSVSEEKEQKLKDMGCSISRISGSNRYETNRNIIEKFFKGSNQEAIFVSGENFADSISIGTYAYINNVPIVLIPRKADSRTEEYIKNIRYNKSIIVGGKNSIDKEYENLLDNPVRYSGQSRYETSMIINREFFSDSDKIFMTSGENFADALSGIPYSAKNGANLVIYNQNPKQYNNIGKYKELVLVGGSIKNKMEYSAVKRREYNKNYIDSSEKIIDGQLPIGENTGVYLKYNSNLENFFNAQRGEQRSVFSFFYLIDLVNAYNDTGDKKYFDAGMKYIRQFEENHYEITDNMLWHDETTARRLENYLYFYANMNQCMSSNDKYIMKKSMERMAGLMTNSDFWSGNNNHGMFQDMACLEYYSYIGNKELSRKNIKRLSDYFLSTYDKEGVHLENSPEYHFVILKEYKRFLDKLEDDKPGNYGELLDRYNKTKEFSKFILLPDGNIPNIGDSKVMKIDLRDYYDDSSLEDKIYSTERRSFLNSGYDIVKNYNSYLLLRGGYLKDYHHHNDDLSFWLYKDGNIFTEAGSYGYEYSEPNTNYCRDFEAHNTLIVDGQDRGSGRNVHLNKGQADTLEGETKRISGVDFKRKIQYNDNLSDITINDEIISQDKKNHDYKLLFHLDPEIEVVPSENKIILKRNGNEIGYLETDEKYSIADDLYFPDYTRVIKKTKRIEIEFSGADKNIVTKIHLDN